MVYFVSIIIKNYQLLASGVFYYNYSVFLDFWNGNIVYAKHDKVKSSGPMSYHMNYLPDDAQLITRTVMQI